MFFFPGIDKHLAKSTRHSNVNFLSFCYSIGFSLSRELHLQDVSIIVTQIFLLFSRQSYHRFL